MRFKTEITGIREVDDLLKRIAPRHAKNILRTTVHDVARELAKEARENAPHSGGAASKGGKHFNTAAVIKHRRDKQNRGSSVLSSSVRVFGAWSYFWKLLEIGTNDTKEYAMFRKAVESVRPRLRSVFLASFKKKLVAAVNREKKKAM